MNGIQNGWKQIKDSVNNNVTAEDISMSLLYSFYSKNSPIAVAIPHSQGHVMSCAISKKMHTDSAQKRTAIFLDVLDVLGYYKDGFHFKPSDLWVDVMPSFNETLCRMP